MPNPHIKNSSTLFIFPNPRFSFLPLYLTLHALAGRARPSCSDVEAFLGLGEVQAQVGIYSFFLHLGLVLLFWRGLGLRGEVRGRDGLSYGKGGELFWRYLWGMNMYEWCKWV